MADGGKEDATRGDDREDGSDRYVHDPAGDPEGDGPGRDGHDPAAPGRATADPGPPTDREFGWRGWVLVGFTVVAFFVVPGLLLALAYSREVVLSFGLTWRQAYLLLPLVPALLLGALAVWATTR